MNVPSEEEGAISTQYDTANEALGARRPVPQMEKAGLKGTEKDIRTNPHEFCTNQKTG